MAWGPLYHSLIGGFLVHGMLGSIKFEVRPCVANWKHARNSEGIASLGEKPLKEEEASVESFEDIYVDKHNKEDFQTDTIRLVLSLVVLGSMLL